MDSTELSKQIRLNALAIISRAKSSHIGSVYSIADILAVLYTNVLAKNPEKPEWEERDRFILSKGHAGAGLYVSLAETGYFPKEILDTYYSNGSVLSGHCSHDVPGVELSTGSLGHGLPIAAGMALSAKLDGSKHRVYVLLGDGECDEGSNWEANLFAAHHKLSNLVVIVDYNKLQSLASVEKTLNLEPFADKWRAFGWEINEVDGHDHKQLKSALDLNPVNSDKPTCILAHTVKGKGVSFMENSVLWHYRSPQGEELEQARKELRKYYHEKSIY